MKFNLVNLFKHKKVIICFLILAFIFCFIFIYYSFEEGFTNVDVIKNGDFRMATLNSINEWTIEGIKSKEQSTDKYALASSENGGLLVKINLLPNKDIFVSQGIELEEGETYKLTFSYAGTNASKLNVHIDGIPIGSNYVAEGIQKTDAINYTSMKTGQYTLSFTINSGNFTRGETTLLLSKISMTQQTHYREQREEEARIKAEEEKKAKEEKLLAQESQLQAQEIQLKAQEVQLQTQIREVQLQRDQLQVQAAKIQAQEAQLQAQRDQLLARSQNQLTNTNLRNQLTRLNVQINNLKIQKNNLQNQKNNLQNQNNILQNQKNDLQNQKNDLQNQNNNLRTQKNNLEAKLRRCSK